MAEPILIISPYFAPRPRIGAQRATKFARHLPDFGYVPHIVSLDPGEAGQSVIQLTTPVDRTHRRSGSALGATGNPQGLDALDRWIPIDSWVPVMWWNRARVVEHAREKGIRLVWSTGDPWSGHLLAETVADALGVPWIADWRDPWTLCPVRNQDRPAWVRALDRRVERHWMLRATLNTFTAQETERRYRSAYGIATTTIHNAFDHDDISSGEPAPGNEFVELLFFGRFRDLSPAEPVIRLVASCDHPSRVRVVSFGPLGEADLQLASRLGVAECFVSEPPIPLATSMDRLRKADFLLLSTDPRRDEIIPAKLWDYLPAGRPILSLVPNRDVDQVVRHTGTGSGVAPLTQLNRYLTDRTAMAGKPDPAAIRTYAAREATAKLVACIREVSG